MVTRPLLSDDQLSPLAAEVFADIRATRGTDFINNFWRALAHDPETLRATWDRLKVLMAPGALDPLTKEMIYIAVSAANSCAYCCHSHTASAKAKGMSDAMLNELLAVIGMASQTNAIANALQVPVDEVFKE
ncbi:carboxymuconolactone decarboxylase family protein [Salipiger sp. 1_MG-2023]|uniref:carboxymuconolactone decarboxylase family protein n=1 Tax=Salipiger sp. 1_MG-2023 TaxID=3062665 RepID=UPI0026E2A818|nr:carboxymuconolactone decarboxylase family protein [Salipiger sp. 1_MG-2023]MDO6585432.1 carboxymuconolactone decarboxylase family protein [Salipiger sp. 1_MG-2023]